MIEVRRATVADADELVRLRGVMLAAMTGPAMTGPAMTGQALTGHEPEGDDWRRESRRTLRFRLGEAVPTLAAYVVEQPGGLAACAVGTVEQRLGGPGNPGGRIGYVFNVATDPEHRRQGHSRRCTTALLAWFREQGVATVDLKATPDAEPLYRSLGFVPSAHTGMRLQLPA